MDSSISPTPPTAKLSTGARVREVLRRSQFLRDVKRRVTTPHNRRRLRRMALLLGSPFIGRSLRRLAAIAGTDKWGGHWYAQHYEAHFARLRHKRLNLLEIGIGGYDDPQLGGESLLVWKHYFPRARIYGLDIHPKHGIDEHRIRAIQGSQADAELLRRVSAEVGGFDIVIDDGSHLNEHVIATFEVLFPLLHEGGMYVVEDTQTSYWPAFGGTSDDLRDAPTMMNFFKQLVDTMNHPEFLTEGYEPTYYDRHIFAMHFYHNLVFVHKHESGERSNLIVDDAARRRFSVPAS